jgi:hypothetical protein
MVMIVNNLSDDIDEYIINKIKRESQIGLFQGKMGACIYFYFRGRATSNPDYTQFADTLLNEIYSQVSKNSPADFGSGLAGIGWGITYLARSGFVDVDLDEALEEVDNAMLKVIASESSLGMNFTNGLTGYLCYLTQRLAGGNKPDESYSTELNKELLVLTINKMEQCFLKMPPIISKDICFDLFSDLPMMIFSLGQAYSLGCYNKKIEQLVKQVIPFLETNMPSLNINRLHLACELKCLLTQIPNKRIARVADVLLYSVDFSQLLYEVGANAMGIRNGLSGLKILLNRLRHILPPDSVYQNSAFCTLESIPPIESMLPDENKSITPSMLGLAEGLAGVRLADIFGFHAPMNQQIPAQSTPVTN